MALIKLPWIYLPNKDKFGTYFNAKIWIGVADDPNPRLNQKEVRLIQESGSTVIAQQPIRTNAGGLPVFNGAVVALDVTGDYSLAIDDSNDNQKYYFPNNGVTEDLLASDLRSVMFDLGFVYEDIGVKLITDAVGTSLDGAEYILNTTTGEVWNLGDTIPAGATVVSLTGNNLVTSLGAFTLEPKQSDITQGIENQIKVNQNWNVSGKDNSLSTANQTITNGNEFTLGWVAHNADIVDIARSASGITTWLTGTARYTLPKDLNGLLTVDNIKFYVNDGAGNQIEADGANGLTVSDDATNIYLDINETQGVNGVGFVGWSLFEGVIPTINDAKSSVAGIGQIIGTFTATNATNNINMTGIGAIPGLEIGDVIQVINSTSNDNTYTVDAITDAGNIIVNQPHAAGSISKSLTDEVSTAGVTIVIISKWYNASVTLGLGAVSSSRTSGVTYNAPEKRELQVIVKYTTSTGTNPTLTIDGVTVSISGNSNAGAIATSVTFVVPRGSSWSVNAISGTITDTMEFR